MHFPDSALRLLEAVSTCDNAEKHKILDPSFASCQDPLLGFQQTIKTFDPQNTGLLDYGALVRLLDDNYRFKFTHDELSEVKHLFGSRGNAAKVRYKDFIAGVISLKTDIFEENLNHFRELISLAKEQGIDCEHYFEQYDNDKKGLISLEQFRFALKALGVELHQFQVELLSSQFQAKLSKYDTKVDYRRFLEKICLDEFTDKNKESKQIDVLEKLRHAIETFCEEREEHELWTHFENFDNGLTGHIPPVQLFQAMDILNLKLSNVDKRRIILRIMKSSKGQVLDESGEILIPYRELLYMLFHGIQIDPLRMKQTTDTSATQFKEHKKKGFVQKKSLIETSVIENISIEELDSVYDFISNEIEKYPNLELDDIFEQFDLSFRGVIEREQFIKCLVWLNLRGISRSSVTYQTVADTVLHNRIANRYIESNGEALVNYRQFLLEYHKYSEQKRTLKFSRNKLDTDPTVLELSNFIEGVRNKVKSLEFSGLHLEDSFKRYVVEGSNKISRRNFKQALLDIGVNISTVKLSILLSSFETQNNSSEIEINYVDFSKIIRGDRNLEQKWFKKSLKNATDNQDSDGLKRFDACKILRDRVRQTVFEFSKPKQNQNGHSDDMMLVLKKCFYDLDMNSDGIVEASDLIKAFELFGYRLDDEEAEKVASIVLLYEGPYTPSELSAVSIQNALLTFNAFLHLVGFKDMLTRQKSDFKESTNLGKPPLGIINYDVLLGYKDEALVKNKQVITVLKQVCNAPDKDAHSIFEKYDWDFSGCIYEDEMIIALKEAFELVVTGQELLRIASRLGVLHLETGSVGGSEKISYRNFLSKVIKPRVFASTEDELLLSKLRAAVEKKALPEFLCNRRDIIYCICDLLEMELADVFTSPEISRLVRVLENNDGAIRVSEFYQSLQLDISTETQNSLKSLCMSHSDLLVERFQYYDSKFLGTFSGDLCKILSFKEMQHSNAVVGIEICQDEAARLIKRFQVVIVPENHERRFDYRKFLRYFKIKGNEERNISLSLTRVQDHQNHEFETLENGFWKTFWLMDTKQSLQKKKNPFHCWKFRKEKYDIAILLLDQLNETTGENENSWMEVGESLAAIDMYLQLQCVDAPSLRKNWIYWSKRVYRFEDVVVEGQNIAFLQFFKEPKTNTDKSSNDLFIRLCKQQWKECKLRVKSTLTIEHIENRQKGNTISMEKLLDKYGLIKLQKLVEIEKNDTTTKAEAEKERLAKEAKCAHETFVKRKDSLRIALPKSHTKRQQLKKKNGDCSLDLDFIHNANFIHANNDRDLQRCREKLVDCGIVIAENFLEDEEKFQNAKLNMNDGQRQCIDRRRIGSNQQFFQWRSQKESCELAIAYLKAIPSPNSFVGSLQDKNKYWRTIGGYLKTVDCKFLFSNFADWSKNYVVRSKCFTIWNELPPQSLLASPNQSWIWVHLKGVLLKILKKADVDFRENFEQFSNNLAKKKGKSVEEIRRKLLRATKSSYFRQLMNNFGYSLRLQDINRLIQSYPGKDEKDVVIEDTISLSSFFKFSGNRQSSSVAKEKWRSDVFVQHDNLNVEASLEERLIMALQLAGAPDEFTATLKTNDMAVKNALNQLEKIRHGKVASVQNKAESLRTKVPKKPILKKLDLSAKKIETKFQTRTLQCNQLCLTWDVGEEYNDVLFFTLEQVYRDDGQNTLFKTIYRDPQSPDITKKSGLFVVTGLEANTIYEFRLTGFSKYGPSKPTREFFSTLPNTPRCPQVVQAKSVGPVCSCTLSWGEKNKDSLKNIPIAVLQDSDGLVNLSAGTANTRLSKGGNQQLNGFQGYESRAMFQLFELKQESDGLVEFNEENFSPIYYGAEPQVEITGLRQGCVYYFFVRSLNSFGETGPVSDICTVTAPVNAPEKPSISQQKENPYEVIVKWNEYEGFKGILPANGSTKGALKDWDETIRNWGEVGISKFSNKYIVKIVSNEQKRQFVVYDVAEYTITDLSPNTYYKVSFRAEIELQYPEHKKSSTFRTPFSSCLKFYTPPLPPGQPFLVSVSRTEMICRWDPPSGGANSYRLEINILDSGVSVSRNNKNPFNKWVPAYKGKCTLATVSNLKPGSTYRLRVLALSEDGTESAPSLAAQDMTKSTKYNSRLTPNNAQQHFAIPCTIKTYTLGDMILFTEIVKEKTIDPESVCSPTLRTIAGRIVMNDHKKVWLQVEWCTVSARRKGVEIKRFPAGSRIQRKLIDVFGLETECGVYRTKWYDENVRLA